MTTRISGLTGATLETAPTVCHECIWWQTRNGRSTDKRKWIRDAEEESTIISRREKASPLAILGLQIVSRSRAKGSVSPVAARLASSGAVPGRAAPIACAIRPQFGSPPYSAVLISGESATACATRSTAPSSPPRTTTRQTRRAPSPSRTM